MEKAIKKEKLPKRYWIVGFAVILPISIICVLLFIFAYLYSFFTFAVVSICLCTYFGNLVQWLVFHKVQNKTVWNCIVPMGILTFLKIAPYLAIAIQLFILGRQETILYPMLILYAVAVLLVLAVALILFNDYRRYYKKLKNNKVEQ